MAMDRDLCFKLDDTNEVLHTFYEENDNYKVVVNDENNKRCLIFFSGNGLYFPNTYETFHETVEVKNRYEWETVAKSPLLRDCYGTIIFVRDIYKAYYVKGINGRISSIDLLLPFLREITTGMKVVTCGNSAGGYMAVIAGAYLNAEYAFSFGGQWSIENRDEYYLGKYRSERGKYFNITQYAKENVIWFYSALNEWDNAQKNYLREQHKVKIFAIESKYHGYLLLFPCYEKILTIPYERIEALNRKYSGKMISQRRLARELLQGKEFVITLIQDVIHHHRSLQILFSHFKTYILKR